MPRQYLTSAKPLMDADTEYAPIATFIGAASLNAVVAS
jgi:hypothetical protein